MSGCSATDDGEHRLRVDACGKPKSPYYADGVRVIAGVPHRWRICEACKSMLLIQERAPPP